MDRALRLLESFPPDVPSVSLGRLAETAGVVVSTAHRLLDTLAQHGFVTNDGKGHYSLGMRAWEIGSLAVRQRGITPIMHQYLERLVRDVGETGHVSVLDGSSIVYIARLAGHRSVSVQTYLGQRAPAHCTATGKANLSRQPAYVVDELLSKPLAAYTSDTCTDPLVLRRRLEEAAQSGYAVNFGEWQEDLVGAASPIIDFGGYSVAAIGVAGPRYRHTESDLHDIGKVVAAVARDMSRELGSQDNDR